MGCQITVQHDDPIETGYIVPLVSESVSGFLSPREVKAQFDCLPQFRYGSFFKCPKIEHTHFRFFYRFKIKNFQNHSLKWAFQDFRILKVGHAEKKARDRF